MAIERAYLESEELDGRIEITRAVDESGDDLGRPFPRVGTESCETQLSILENSKIVLVDDVVFTGGTIIDITTKLRTYGSEVCEVVAAIGIKNGLDSIAKGTNSSVSCVFEYDEVVDQVCERDFYPGLPYCGRQYYDDASGLGSSFPYVAPFGLLNEWASIPETEVSRFSKLCIQNTIELFEEIERLNDFVIITKMVPRPVYGLGLSDDRYVDVLRKAILSLN